MSFRVAMRIVPNAAELVYKDFESFDALMQSLQLRVKPDIWGGFDVQFTTQAGRRVLVYVNPSEHDRYTLAQYTPDGRGAMHMMPSASDPAKLGQSGGGHWPGAWRMVRPESHPEHALAMANARAKAKEAAKAREAFERAEEEAERALNDALEAAVSARGYDATMAALQALARGDSQE